MWLDSYKYRTMNIVLYSFIGQKGIHYCGICNGFLATGSCSSCEDSRYQLINRKALKLTNTAASKKHNDLIAAVSAITWVLMLICNRINFNCTRNLTRLRHVRYPILFEFHISNKTPNICVHYSVSLFVVKLWLLNNNCSSVGSSLSLSYSLRFSGVLSNRVSYTSNISSGQLIHLCSISFLVEIYSGRSGTKTARTRPFSSSSAQFLHASS